MKNLEIDSDLARQLGGPDTPFDESPTETFESLSPRNAVASDSARLAGKTRPLLRSAELHKKALPPLEGVPPPKQHADQVPDV